MYFKEETTGFVDVVYGWVGVKREESSAYTTSTIERCLSRLARLVGSKFWGEIKSLILDMLNLRRLSHIEIEVKLAAGCLSQE